MTFLSKDQKNLAMQMLRRKGLNSSDNNQLTQPEKSSALSGPLSHPQEGLWFLDQLHPGGDAYSIPCTIRIQGALDVSAISKALQEIVARHQSLRTVFSTDDDGSPLQTVQPDLPNFMEIVDLTSMAEEQREQEVVRRATLEIKKPFDLSIGPLFRVVLIVVAPDDHVLCVNLHHIVADGWSLGIFSRELDALYGDFKAGTTGSLRPLKLQYLDFARWQRRHLRDSNLSQHLSYWRDQLGDVTTSTDLPSANDNRTESGFEGSHEQLKLDSTTTRACRALARSQSVTLYTILLASFYCVLGAVTRERRLVVGSTFANRKHTDFEPIIGHFVNTLPIVAQLDDELTFEKLVGRLQRTVLETQNHQDLSLGTIVKQLDLDRQLGSNPLFSIVFDFLTPDQNPAYFGYGMSFRAEGEYRLGDLRVTPMDVEGGIARFDLAIFLWDFEDSIQGAVEYRSPQIEASAVQALISHFKVAVECAIAAPDIALGDIFSAIERDVDRLRSVEGKKSKNAIRKSLRNIKARASNEELR